MSRSPFKIQGPARIGFSGGRTSGYLLYQIISDIRLRRRPAVIVFKNEPERCAHEWEFHLWEHGEAYCPGCGSFAKALNDPRCEP